MRRPLLAAFLALLPFAAAAAAACPEPAAVEALARSMLSQTPARSYGPGLSLADGQCAQDRLVAILGAEWGGVGARRGVVGEVIAPEATEAFAARLGSMRVRLATDEKVLAEAPGSALLGHPLNVIPWLVEDLAKRGLALRAGDIVSLGGFSPAVPAEAGQRYTATYTGLLAAPVTVSVSLR